jgi:putative SOS response-associated peptidase YedK
MSALYEFTGAKSPKTTRRFTLNDSPILSVVGLWREGKGNAPNSFTLLTTEPGLDVAPHHNRQIVVLRPVDWTAWLNLMKPEGELFAPLPFGTLAAETVQAGG